VSARLVLASASPRRAAILRALGLEFDVVATDIDEAIAPGEDPSRAAERLARAKAEAAGIADSRPVVGADTIVIVDGAVLGKPASAAHAVEMLRRLSGREHEVVTGLCVAHGGRVVSGVDRTRVVFAAMSPAEIDWYVMTGEPMDKAGGYHIDGRGALFVARVDGSSSNVAGLPVRLLYTLAGELGVGLAQGGA
jgi:septum formation protein